VVAVQTMFHSDMLQIRKRSAPHIKSDFKRDFLFAPNWIEILASSFSQTFYPIANADRDDTIPNHATDLQQKHVLTQAITTNQSKNK